MGEPDKALYDRFAALVAQRNRLIGECCMYHEMAAAAYSERQQVDEAITAIQAEPGLVEAYGAFSPIGQRLAQLFGLGPDAPQA